jgi:transposase
MKQAAENFASLESFTGDAAYESVADFAHKGTGLRAAACEKTKAAGFHVIAFRWIVERTFAWFGQCRRLSKDYEKATTSAEAFLWLAMLRLLVRRLA